MASALKNAEKSASRIHRERHQPEWRSELGELEKKADYRKRAADYNSKRDTLVALKAKALERNPDEFHHHMIKSRVTRKGAHADLPGEDAEAASPEHQALLAANNIRYVTYKLNLERKKIEKLQASLHLSDPAVASSSKSKHLIFVDSKEEAKNFKPAEYLDTDESMLGRVGNRPRLSKLAHLNKDLLTKADIVTGAAERRKSYSELRKRVKRERELGVVLHKLENKRNLAKTKGAKPVKVRKGGGKQAAVFKWEYERKK